MKEEAAEKELKKDTVRGSIWIETDIWREFQKKAKVRDRKSGSGKLVEFVETYVKSPELAMSEAPIVTAKELINLLKELQNLITANTCTVETPDSNSDDRVAIVRLPPAGPPSFSAPKLRRGYTPPTEQVGEPVIKNFFINKELWKTFQKRVKREGASASGLLVTFIKEYLGYYDITQNHVTIKVAKHLVSTLNQFQDLLEANAGTVETIDLKGKRVAVIKNPAPDPNTTAKRVRRSIPVKSPIRQLIEGDRQD